MSRNSGATKKLWEDPPQGRKGACGPRKDVTTLDGGTGDTKLELEGKSRE